MGAPRIRMDTRITGSTMKNLKTFILAAALASLAGVLHAQPAKDAPPPPPSGQPTTTIAVPGQAGARDAAPHTEALDNPYGIEALWRQGDFVARGTLIILVIMSVGSW